MGEIILMSSRIDASATQVNTRVLLFENFKVNQQECETSAHVNILRKEISTYQRRILNPVMF